MLVLTSSQRVLTRWHKEAGDALKIGVNFDNFEQLSVLIVNLDRPAFGLGIPSRMACCLLVEFDSMT